MIRISFFIFEKPILIYSMKVSRRTKYLEYRNLFRNSKESYCNHSWSGNFRTGFNLTDKRGSNNKTKRAGRTVVS